MYSVINRIKNQAQTAFFNYILEYCFKICVNYKSGNLLYLWESKQEYGSVKFSKLEYSWHILEDGEVEKYLEETLDGLSKNEYKVSEYARIIPLMLRLEKVGFSSAYLERAVNYMKANLKLLERCMAY